MGGVFSNPSYPSSPTSAPNVNEITITGLGTQWPSTVITADDIEKYALSLYPADAPWWVTFSNFIQSMLT
jgi:type III polyketide synthase